MDSGKTGKPMLFRSLICLAAVALCACKTNEFNFPDVPRIELRSVTVLQGPNGKDSSVTLKIYYEDGDGDIGNDDADTLPPYNFGGPYFNNVHLSLEVLENGSWKKLLYPSSTDTFSYDRRIKSITPTGRKKAIKGEMEFYLRTELPFSYVTDSVRYSLYINDRALHKSNSVSTGLVLLSM